MKNDIDNLPKEWAWTQLGEIALEPQYGWTTSAVDTGKLRLLRTSDITSGRVDWTSVPFCQDEPPNVAKYLLHDGDIVISRAGSVGYSYLVKNPPQAVFASYLIRFKPLIDTAYLDLFLKSPMYWEAILEKSIGIALANVNASKLKQITVPLPPLPEQHRIAAKIEELFTRLDAGVKAMKKIKTQLKRYRQSVLKQAFEGKLTEEWRETHRGEIELASVLVEKIIKKERGKNAKGKAGELPAVETSDLPELPEGWVWTRIEEIGEVETGTTPPKSKAEYYGKDYRFYKPTDLNAGYYTKNSRDGLSALGLKEARLLPEYSVLVTCIGATIGKTGFIRREGASNQQINAIIPYEGIYPEYVYFICISPQFQRSIIQHASATTLPILSKRKFEILPLPIPPNAEQHKIVEEIERRFSIADQIEKTVDHSLKQAERLCQSILKRAFEGKLVPQDPNDEPAEKLLERIKQERTKHQATLKSAKSPKSKANTSQMRLV